MRGNHLQHIFRLAVFSACLLPLSLAARAQTQRPAMSFNVLAFGDPAANKRVLRGANNEILPVDYSLVSALNTDVTRSMLGDGLDPANAINNLNSGMNVIGGRTGSSFSGEMRRGMGEAGSARSFGRDSAFGFGRKGASNGGSGSKMAALPSNGAASIGFDTIALTGQDPNRNVFAVRASDMSHVSRLALHIPAAANAVINVMGAARPTGNFPSIVGAPSENILVNFVSADNGSTSGSATGNGQTGLGFAASALAGTNPNSPQDPIGAFGAVSGGSAAGVFGSGGAGQMAAANSGNGGIRPAGSPPTAVSSVLPENSGLLLLSFGLLGLLPLMRRQR